MKSTFRIFLLSVLFTGVLQAQDVKVTAAIDSNKYLIGQWIVTHLTVEAPNNIRVFLPTKPEQFDKATFVSATPEKVTEQNGVKRYVQDLTLTCFDTGAFNFTVSVRCLKPNDTTNYSFASNPVAVEIATVKLDTMITFKDIKEVMHVSLTIWDYLLYIGIVLVIAGGVWYGYRWWKKRPAPVVAEAPPPPPLPAHIIALQKLHTLEDKRLWQAGQAKAYQSELTDTLREYVEKRFEFPALEETTGEIIAGITLQGLEPALITDVEHILRTADMTKFAKYQPTPQEHLTAMAVSYDFVDKTMIEDLYIPVHEHTAPAGEAKEADHV
jgi:hypothetical protein